MDLKKGVKLETFCRRLFDGDANEAICQLTCLAASLYVNRVGDQTEKHFVAYVRQIYRRAFQIANASQTEH
jgi:hypothetical protein